MFSNETDGLSNDAASSVQQHPDGGKVVVGHGAPLAKGNAQCLELTLRPAHSDSEDEPPSTELVDVAGQVREMHGVTVRDYR